jgi:high-affinity iron transporter
MMNDEWGMMNKKHSAFIALHPAFMIRRLARFLLLCLLAATIPVEAVFASSTPPAQQAELIRSALFQAQLAFASDPARAESSVAAAESAYTESFVETIASTDPAANDRVRAGFESLKFALVENDAPAFAAARARTWTAVLAGSYGVVEKALQAGDGLTAQTWLPVREFRVATRFSRPGADATLAVEGVLSGAVTPADALLSVRADLLDTYQARLSEALRDLAAADANGFASRRAELAALAEGYFNILAPAYAEQRGAAALAETQQVFASLRLATLTPKTNSNFQSLISNLQSRLRGFRAAPLSPAEQVRRAGQLLRYLSLAPIEYGRGVADGRVTRDFEIQEAITFHHGAQAAFADLENLLDARDSAKTMQAAALIDSLDTQLTAASTGGAVTAPDQIQSTTDQLTTLLKETMPEEWQKGSAAGDFDVIASMLDQMEAAVRQGEYDLAESARLEAYAVMETGPEARLMVFAPQLKLQLEELFWNGQGDQKGLAHLIKAGAPLSAIRASRDALDVHLNQAQTMLSERSAPAAVVGNAAIIVFREGLEAVLILASLLGSMKLGDSRKYRPPMWIGAGLALLATVLTWLLARGVLLSLARFGEKLEAVVSLIAIAVLLVITNWFFHKTYWNNWIASFHAQKRKLLSGETSLWLGLIALGFTSVYREGFETVLFLQALVLEAGSAIVLTGVGAGLAATLLIGLVTFKVQARLPYKKMLIATGILIGGVLLVMVGNTTHVLQVVGWLPIHLIPDLTLPYWTGLWFGLYPTWEGLLFQAAAAVFVIGSYYLAERVKDGRVTPSVQTVASEA